MSSGRTSVDRVTVPLMHRSRPTLSVFIARIRSMRGKL